MKSLKCMKSSVVVLFILFISLSATFAADLTATSGVQSHVNIYGEKKLLGETYGTLRFRNTDGGSNYWGARIKSLNEDGNQSGNLIFETNANNSGLVERMCIDRNGNIGIGTSAPQSTLDVAGTIKANEIIVVSSGADYVFADDYKLPSLESVEKFITTNKHLPEIPSANELQKEGMDLSKMVTKQLQKIEELTLYVIELKKENVTLKNETKAIKQLQVRIAEIETAIK